MGLAIRKHIVRVCPQEYSSFCVWVKISRIFVVTSHAKFLGFLHFLEEDKIYDLFKNIICTSTIEEMLIEITNLNSFYLKLHCLQLQGLKKHGRIGILLKLNYTL